ncbi:MAG: signal peptidase I [Planctomycetota bacterium]|nr:signal peptidase I [Planctomycetota bacterium]
MSAKTAHTSRPWRENIEAITMAIVVAILLKYFIVEAYKIPTGSMQPTLMGNTDTGIFDRVLVDKLSYHYRDPERWEVAVFKYPLNRTKNFIKRIVGMPGEELMIRHGDLWTRTPGEGEWTILRRPRPVQLEVWKELETARNWKPSPGTSGWSLSENGLRARGNGSMRFPRDGSAIMDNYTDGYPGDTPSKIRHRPGRSGQHAVGDLRLAGTLTALPGLEELVLEFKEGRRSYRFSLPGPAADPQATARVSATLGTGQVDLLEASGRFPFRLAAGEAVEIDAQNMDDLLSLRVAGDVLLELEIAPATHQAASIAIHALGENGADSADSANGSGADLDELRVFRDIYYLSDNVKVWNWPIPEGHYVVLGDNTQDSADSREWTFARYEVRPEVGSDEVQVLRGDYRPRENPIVLPGGEDGPQIFLRDEWGELHTFPGRLARKLAPTQTSLVPRELVVGRAVLVFWPMAPSLSVYRMHWVH